jgi:hypothetical protein
VLGTFPWQMQPYCNVITLTLTATPTGFTLDGTDDQCGAPSKASAVGTASFDASGNVTLSLTVVAAPGGRPSQVSAVVSPATGSGTWSDGTTASGTFAFFGATPNLPERPTLAGTFVTGNGGDDTFTLSSSDAVVRSVGFTLTGPMRVMATASGYFSFHSAAATHEIGRCSITTGTAVDDVAIFGSDAGSTLAPSFQPFSAVRLFSATAGNFTARLVCNQAAGAVRVNDANLVLLFVPR